MVETVIEPEVEEVSKLVFQIFRSDRVRGMDIEDEHFGDTDPVVKFLR